jgi:DNA-binding transcriptional ArsR family regulator
MGRELRDKLAIYDEPKLTILKTLYLCSDQPCGCELVTGLEMPKNLLSYHLKILITHGYIESVRCGRKKHYTIAKNMQPKVKEILKVLDLI